MGVITGETHQPPEIKKKTYQGWRPRGRAQRMNTEEEHKPVSIMTANNKAQNLPRMGNKNKTKTCYGLEKGD